MSENNENGMLDDFASETPDDELYSLFSALDGIKASDDLQNATLARIFALSGEGGFDAEAADPKTPNAFSASSTPGASSTPSTPSAMKAFPGGKKTAGSNRSKWRTIRVAAIAACLVMALSGGVAYATPAQYYEIAQNGSMITLGVNCFGITVSATADDDEGEQVIESTDLRGMPYEDSLAKAIETMGRSNPSEPIEYGPRGGEHETVPAVQPDGSEGDDGAGVGNGDGNAPGGNPSEMQGDPNAGSGNQAPGNVRGGPDDTGEPSPEGEGSPQGDPRP